MCALCYHPHHLPCGSYSRGDRDLVDSSPRIRWTGLVPCEVESGKSVVKLLALANAGRRKRVSRASVEKVVIGNTRIKGYSQVKIDWV